MIGVALGVLIGNALESNGVMEEQVAYPGMIFLFGGLALVIGHFVIAKISIKDQA